MPDIRTFIAVDVPKEIKMELDKLIASLKSYGPEVRWVRAANLHVTLRFLGDIPQESVPMLAKEIEKNIAGFGQFDISLSGLGGFPNLKRPRVIWVGTGVGEDKIVKLAELVEKSCIDAGFGKSDKQFSSHLTIGRIKFPHGLESVVSKIETMKFETAPFKITEVVIFKSDLLPSGPKYTRLESIAL